MNLYNVNSYPELNIEYELPFYLRAVGSNDEIRPVNHSGGYNRHYIGIIKNGEIKLQLGSHFFRLKKGDGFFVRAHFPFQFHSVNGKAAVQWMSFDGYATVPLFSKLQLENYIIFHDLDLTTLSIDFSEMYLTSINKDKTSRLRNSARVYKILIELYAATEEGRSETESGFRNPSFLRGKRCIEQYYYTQLTQREIAEAANVTPQYLCRLFQSNLHMTPIAYLNTVRINEAKRLLASTSLPIQTIGEKVGFLSPHYFSHTFQKLEGVTATKYRELAKIAANR